MAMKPDNINTGAAESVPNTDGISIENNEKNFNSIAKVESQPGLGASSSPLANPKQQTSSPTQATKSTPQDQDEDSQSGNFEKHISSLPAEDTEVIEKEWIDKVDEIIQKTASEPYFEDQAHHALSKAYLKKRFDLGIK